jgi:hypothetical protein
MNRRLLSTLLSASLISTLMLFIAPPATAASIGSGSCVSTANSDANVVVSSSGGYCYVAFKGTGTNSWTAPAGTTSADFLIVAGGGAGGSGAWGGGGGAGGVVFYSGYSVSSSSATQLKVGVGGTPGTATLDPAANRSGNGESSWIGSASGVVAIGGGAGASYAYNSTSENSSGSSGGSGGGATENTSTNNGGSSTQTLPSGAAFKYGNAGGSTPNAAYQSGGGGGGAGAVGGAVTGSGAGGAGGAGINTYATYVNLFSIGVSGYIAGGGGGGTNGATRALGGSSVGGRGGASGSLPGEAATANTGSGGGGTSYSGGPYQGGSGGTGLIIIRYSSVLASASLTLAPGNLIYRQAKAVTAISTVAGKITFRVAGKVIPGCKNKVVNAGNSFTATCSYRPSNHSYVRISATLVPDDIYFSELVTNSALYLVTRRTGAR